MKSNPQAAAAKWATAMSGAGTAYSAGVNAVTVAPGAKAAAAVNNYTAGVANNAQKWAQNVNAVTLNEWQTAATTKGAPRLASGAQAAQPKFTTFMTALLQFEANAINQLPPRGPKGTNDQRMLQWSQIMQTFKKPAGS